MKNISPAMVLPILATVNLFLQLFFGVKLDETQMQEIATGIVNVVSFALVIWGIWKNFHKKNDEPPDA